MTAQSYEPVTIFGIRSHGKASEKYVDVLFRYADGTSLSTAVPTEYRRTATEIQDADVSAYLNEVYDEINPANWESWRVEQRQFWDSKPRAAVTRPFFEILSQDFQWCCAQCTLPKNSNFARRIQDIKEYGYTLATNPKRFCSRCAKKTTHIALLPIKRGGLTGYEFFSPTLRNRIIKILGSYDAYEAKIIRNGLLPDHKFPEIRWDVNTRRESLEELTDEELKRDFQLLSNQRNQQKREVCRACFQDGKRGTLFGIRYFYHGSHNWDVSIPRSGKNSEAGCVGCGWYDIQKWREALIATITNG